MQGSLSSDELSFGLQPAFITNGEAMNLLSQPLLQTPTLSLQGFTEPYHSLGDGTERSRNSH